jgi:hypothetical protein
MSKSAVSVLVFGLYISLLALGFLIVPAIFTSLFGLADAQDVWVRIAAMLLLGLAYYYIQMARQGHKPFFRFSAQARALVIVFFGLFVLLDMARPTLIILGAIDFLAAAWTALALRAEGEPIFKIR